MLTEQEKTSLEIGDKVEDVWGSTWEIHSAREGGPGTGLSAGHSSRPLTGPKKLFRYPTWYLPVNNIRKML
jgi:hypothetical protein